MASQPYAPLTSSRTPLDPGFEEALIRDIVEVTHYLERSPPAGAFDETGCAILAMLHPSLKIVRGNVAAVVVHPDPDRPDKVAMHWVGGRQLRGVWLTYGDVLIDPFLDQRLRIPELPQTLDWFEYPIIMRTIRNAPPYDVIYLPAAEIPIMPKHRMLADLFELSRKSHPPVQADEPCILSDLGPAHIGELSIWARAMAIASIKKAPVFASAPEITESLMPPAIEHAKPEPEPEPVRDETAKAPPLNTKASIAAIMAGVAIALAIYLLSN